MKGVYPRPGLQKETQEKRSGWDSFLYPKACFACDWSVGCPKAKERMREPPPFVAIQHGFGGCVWLTIVGILHPRKQVQTAKQRLGVSCKERIAYKDCLQYVGKSSFVPPPGPPHVQPTSKPIPSPESR